VVIGDFNRRFNIAGDDMWADLDDGGPDLTKYTEGLTSACLNFRFPEDIDHIVTGPRATTLVRPGSFEQVLFTTVDPDGDADLSDDCPIAVVFETDGEIETSDAITDLLRRLDAVLREIRDAVSALREYVNDRRALRSWQPLPALHKLHHTRQLVWECIWGCSIV
jgi:hypothetical protein